MASLGEKVVYLVKKMLWIEFMRHLAVKKSPPDPEQEGPDCESDALPEPNPRILQSVVHFAPD
jgi:hypothetical protein